MKRAPDTGVQEEGGEMSKWRLRVGGDLVIIPDVCRGEGGGVLPVQSAG